MREREKKAPARVGPPASSVYVCVCVSYRLPGPGAAEWEREPAEPCGARDGE